MTEAPRAIIVGGGIGGLATALGLKSRGWEVVVVEQQGGLREIGAGLTLQPNAVQCLHVINPSVAQRVHEISYEVGDINSFSLDGQFLDSARTRSTLYRSELQQHFGHAVWMVHRGELIQALGKELGSAHVCTGIKVERIESDGKIATVYGSNGFQQQADLVVGADGIHSVVRRVVLERLNRVHGDILRNAGIVAWRGIADLTLDNENDSVGQSWGMGITTGLFAMTHDRCYWWVTQPLTAQGKSFPDHKAHLLALLPLQCQPHLRACIQNTREIHCDILMDRLPLSPPWGFDNITLIGDAAHPTTPYLGQGAAQALEDAASLALHLQDGKADIVSTIRAFERVRYPKSSAITNTSWTFGAILGPRSKFGTQLSYFFVKYVASLVHWRQLKWILTPSIEPAIAPAHSTLKIVLLTTLTLVGLSALAFRSKVPMPEGFARFYR